MPRLPWLLALALASALAACGEVPPPEVAATVHLDAVLEGEVKHLTLFAFGPRLSDGVFLPCSVLIERLVAPLDPRLDQLARSDVDFSDPATRRVTLDGVTPGPNRLVYVEASAAGSVVANGCTDEVEVGSGEITTVEIVLYRVP